MGNQRKYYKKVLQYFAHCLDKKLAQKMSKEDSIEKLEEFILKRKEIYDEKHFYYEAGCASQLVLRESNEDGCDGFNSYIGGINEFESLLGLYEEGEV